MKKILFATLLFLAALSLPAQERMSYSMEIVAGAGFGRGPAALVTPQFVAQYELGGGFKLGAGAGLRLAMPCDEYYTRSTGSHRSFINELDIPLFLRLGYGGQKLYANIDAGYALGLFSLTPLGAAPGGFGESCYGGLFIDPQIGYKISPRKAIALGVLIQQSTIMDKVSVETPTSSTVTATKNRYFTPAITLRYVILF